MNDNPMIGFTIQWTSTPLQYIKHNSPYDDLRNLDHGHQPQPKERNKKHVNTWAVTKRPWFFAGFLGDEILSSFFFERLEWRIIRIPSNQSWLHGFPVIFSEFFYQASHLYAVHAAIVRSPETPGRQEIKRLETDLRFAAIFRSEGQIHGFLRWKLSNRIDTL